MSASGAAGHRTVTRAGQRHLQRPHRTAPRLRGELRRDLMADRLAELRQRLPNVSPVTYAMIWLSASLVLMMYEALGSAARLS